jgi:hypothetical protein
MQDLYRCLDRFTDVVVCRTNLTSAAQAEKVISMQINEHRVVLIGNGGGLSSVTVDGVNRAIKKVERLVYRNGLQTAEVEIGLMFSRQILNADDITRSAVNDVKRFALSPVVEDNYIRFCVEYGLLMFYYIWLEPKP